MDIPSSEEFLTIARERLAECEALVKRLTELGDDILIEQAKQAAKGWRDMIRKFGGTHA